MNCELVRTWVKKKVVYEKKQVQHTVSERRVLGYTKHPFVVTLHWAFMDEDNTVGSTSATMSSKRMLSTEGAGKGHAVAHRRNSK
mgnify:CR=1 FL=1